MIALPGGLYIAADSRQFIIKEKKVYGPDAKMPGTEYYDDLAYTTTLAYTLECVQDILLKRKIREKPDMSLSEAIQTAKVIARDIRSATDGVTIVREAPPKKGKEEVANDQS